MELIDYRERFPILAETTYLISHSLGPHFFNTDEEIELAVATLKEIVDRGATLPAAAGTG